MIETLQSRLLLTLAQGLVAGIISAAAVDFDAFKRWKSWNEFQQYSWRIAMVRWAKGGVIGVLSAAGFAGLT